MRLFNAPTISAVVAAADEKTNWKVRGTFLVAAEKKEASTLLFFSSMFEQSSSIFCGGRAVMASSKTTLTTTRGEEKIGKRREALKARLEERQKAKNLSFSFSKTEKTKR